MKHTSNSDRSRKLTLIQWMASLNILQALFIIIWGAWVRLSGSGAGCGEHWPLCNGEVIPLAPEFQTLIEYTHRLTSGIFGITVLASLVLSWSFSKSNSKSNTKSNGKSYGSKSQQGILLLSSAKWVLILTIVEALIGAVLVKAGLVGTDTSYWRAVVIGGHLINTFLLLGALSVHLVAAYDFNRNLDQRQKQSFKSLSQSPTTWQTVLFLLVGATGAITALGNTLFPDSSLAQGMARDFSAEAPLLIQLRIFHPISAITLGLWLLGSFSNRSFVFHLSWIALGFGVLNWLLMAPVWGALIHLTLADFLWMAFVIEGWLGVELLRPKSVVRSKRTRAI